MAIQQCASDFKPKTLNEDPIDPCLNISVGINDLPVNFFSGKELPGQTLKTIPVKRGKVMLKDIPCGKDMEDIPDASKAPKSLFKAADPGKNKLMQDWYHYYCHVAGRKLQFLNHCVLHLHQEAYNHKAKKSYLDAPRVKLALCGLYRSLADLSREFGGLNLTWPLSESHSVNVNGFCGCIQFWHDSNSKHPNDPDYSYGFVLNFCLVLKETGCSSLTGSTLNSPSSVFNTPPPPPPPFIPCPPS